MFPLRDDNPTFSTPVMTVTLVVANILAWFALQGAGSEPLLTRSVCSLGLIPGELLGLAPDGLQIQVSAGSVCEVNHASANWLSPILSMFLHGGWFHLLGNMWFLWIFGNNVEDSMGSARFIAFYLLCGLAAALAQTISNPASPIPMVGASGAIGGVMGAYASLYPRARVQMLIFLGFFVTRAAVPALVVLGYWFLLQVLGGIPTLQAEGGGVAFWAHVGGFAAGYVLSFVFRDPVRVAAHRRALGVYTR
ncbi:MAG TPA: rhomboid family intramembrane serine protease [Candidatus Limnocylindrales bacterium]|nr:rhomboid family intramembrane serine protease [Candidatus Limnocylindrales bacterium]